MKQVFKSKIYEPLTCAALIIVVASAVVFDLFPDYSFLAALIGGVAAIISLSSYFALHLTLDDHRRSSRRPDLSAPAVEKPNDLEGGVTGQIDPNILADHDSDFVFELARAHLALADSLNQIATSNKYESYRSLVENWKWSGPVWEARLAGTRPLKPVLLGKSGVLALYKSEQTSTNFGKWGERIVLEEQKEESPERIDKLVYH